MLLLHDGDRETLLQEVVVECTARDVLWLVALPSSPSSVRDGDPAVLERLDALTTVGEPYHESLRRGLFGPSIVTVLTRRFIDRPRGARAAEEAEPPGRRLELVEYEVFTGSVKTSSITGRPGFPEVLDSLLTRAGGIDPGTEQAIAAYLNREFALVALRLRDPRPNAGELARIGPISFEFATETPMVPLGLAELSRATPLRLHVASATPLAPVSLEAFWNTHPWLKRDRATNIFDVSYNRPVTGDDPIDFELRQRAELALPQDLRMMTGELLLPAGPRVDLDLTRARESIPLPASGGRGSALDLAAAMLLGLAPLLYTPESWFLLWLESRRRQGTKKAGRPLWATYALGVGLYWFFTLPAGGRIAAVIPALIGLIQLALPFADREPTPIRVQFKKKRPGAKA